MATFLDTNILVYLLNSEESHHDWAVKEFTDSKLRGPALIADIVYCELSAGMNSKDQVDAAVEQLGIERTHGDDPALFRAGQAYKQYKSGGGQKKRVLPDFIIGAIADSAGAPLITNNASDFAKYFPGLQLISPG